MKCIVKERGKGNKSRGEDNQETENSSELSILCKILSYSETVTSAKLDVYAKTHHAVQS